MAGVGPVFSPPRFPASFCYQLHMEVREVEIQGLRVHRSGGEEPATPRESEKVPVKFFDALTRAPRNLRILRDHRLCRLWEWKAPQTPPPKKDHRSSFSLRGRFQKLRSTHKTDVLERIWEEAVAG